jgi:hypothetical protein
MVTACRICVESSFEFDVMSDELSFVDTAYALLESGGHPIKRAVAGC